MTEAGQPVLSKVGWSVVLVIFAIALVMHVVALDLPRVMPGGAALASNRWQPQTMTGLLENDERVYRTLVSQLDAGKGYTLRGHAILDEPWINREQYDRALFFHPPGGVVLFCAFHAMAGEGGFAIAQVFCFALFFWSIVLLSREVLPTPTIVTTTLVAGLAAVTPIMSHVSARFWLDGPVLAFVTAAAALFFLGWRRRNWLVVVAAGAVLGYAALIKVSAVFVVPGLAATAWAIAPCRDSSPWPYFAAFLATGLVIQMPWEFIQWMVVGSPFPVWAGRPAAALVETNPFIYYLTVVRSPWIYVTLLPQVLWTLAPSMILFAIQWSNLTTRRIGLALMAWMATIVGAHVWLGADGYSKLLRYVILVTPAAILLFAGMFGELIERLHDHRDLFGRRAVTIALVALAVLGAGLEMLQGLVTTFYDNARIDVIMPLTGLAGFSR